MNSSGHATQIHVLVVEDDEDDYILTVDLLRNTESFDFVVEWASNTFQARALFSENRHDICLMDYTLGAEVGVNLVREALTLGFTAPIIMLSGQENTGVEIAAAAAGAVDYLQKDHLGREQLLRAIRYALARSEIQAERYERIRAESANHAKSEFLATLSHEIRTPLTTIIGYTELLIHKHQESDSDLAEKLQVINRNGAHLMSLLNDTLDLSKIEAGKLEINLAQAELGPFVLNVISLIKEMAQVKNLGVELSATSPLPRFIHTDEMRLRQILLNLLGNAIKFTETGKVELQLNYDGSCLEFHVIDSGKGISRSELENIFAPFTQLSPGHVGTGLGLTISQKLAKRLGGSISVHSIAGQGSRFIVRIDPGPVNMEETADLTITAASSQASIRIGTTVPGSVLVVDDVDDIRELISNILAEAGISTFTADSGVAALRQLADAEPGSICLILMDINMPQMDGYQTLRNLRDRGYPMPVIALTAASLKGEREKCLRAGFSGYLPKPVTAGLLLAEIESQLKPVEQDARKLAAADSILVIEDSPDANAAICMLLQLSGYQVMGAHNRAEAVEQFRQLQPAIVLADLNLGDCDGLTLLRQFQNEVPSGRYFVLSGESGDRAEELPNFIEGFISKPVTLGTLRSALGTPKQ